MGSSTSKPRKGHEHPKHLPKVGTPANDKWEHDERMKHAFGSGGMQIVMGVLVVLGILGLLLLAF